MPPEDLLRKLAASDPGVLREYPSTAGLAGDIATRLGVDPEQVVVTTGADGALDRVCRTYLEPGRSVMIPLPAFEMLRRFVALTGAEVLNVAWDDGFPVAELLAALRPDTSLIVVTSPNNPTGQTITKEELTLLAEGAADRTILLDLAYGEYADGDLTGHALEYANLIVVRTLSKAWGLAGARVGYAVARRETADALRSAGNPYPVSGLSLALAREWLASGEAELTKHVDRVKSYRDEISRLLRNRGVPLPDSQANFVFPDFGDRAEFIDAALQSLGIVVRRFPHRPEIATGIRISLPRDEDGMKRLTQALDQLLDPDAVLLDLDGVLADVSESYRACVLEVVRSLGVDVDEEDVARLKRAGNANNDWIVTQRILASHGIDMTLEEVVDRYQAFYLGDGTNTPLRERETLIPAVDAVGAVKGDRKLAIVTGRPRDEAAWFLERMGVAGLVDTMVCMEDAPAKPDPAPVKLALEMLGAKRAWMVGDTRDDVDAALQAGVLPIGIVAPGDSPEVTATVLEDSGAAIVLSEFSELSRYLP